MVIPRAREDGTNAGRHGKATTGRGSCDETTTIAHILMLATIIGSDAALQSNSSRDAPNHMLFLYRCKNHIRNHQLLFTSTPSFYFPRKNHSLHSGSSIHHGHRTFEAFEQLRTQIEILQVGIFL